MADDELMEKAKRIAAGDPTSFHRLEYQAIISMLLSAEAKNAVLLIERDAAFKMSRCECAVEECCGNLIAADDRAEKAEIKNAELLAALEEIKGRVQFGTSTHKSSDVVKLCDAALKEGK